MTNQQPAAFVGAAWDGPLDVVGDVHGEIDALEDLLAVLGYSGRGDHPGARRLVFIGDLCDRGPDSPAVVRRVREMVAAGTAQCLLGNHELNLLRGSRKDANGWFYPDDHDRRRGRFLDSRPPADAAERATILGFFAQLPLALERPDLRLVHACWDDERIAQLRTANASAMDPVALYRRYAQEAEAAARASGLQDEVEALLRHYGPLLSDPQAEVPLLTPLAISDVLYQMSNPLRVLTSGVETPAEAPFFLSGKWRMVERVDWWSGYESDVPALFGHYWRWPVAELGDRFGPYARDPFPGRGAHEWVGPRNTAYCIDFCAGARYAERQRCPGEPFRSRLGAVRWPERELLYDDGTGAELAEPTAPAG